MHNDFIIEHIELPKLKMSLDFGSQMKQNLQQAAAASG